VRKKNGSWSMPSTHEPHLLVLEGHSCLSKPRLVGRNVTKETLLDRHAISFVLHPFAQQPAHDGAGVD